MENVPQLKKHAVYTDFYDKLEDLGYHVSVHEVYCPDYGIPQRRTRLVLFASLLGKISIIPKTHSASNYRTVESAIGNLPSLKHGEVCDTDFLHRTSSLSKTNLSRIRKSKPGGTWRDWPDNLVADCHRKDTGKTYPKRPDRSLTEGELTDQGDKYRNGLQKLLEQHGRGTEQVEVVFLIGRWPRYWDEQERRRRNREVMRQKNMRVLLYSELLANANRIYKEYLDKRKETGRIQRLLNSIEKADLPS